MIVRSRSGRLVDNEKHFREVRIWDERRQKVDRFLFMLILK